MFCTNCNTEFTGNYCPNCGKNYSASTHEYYDKDGDLIDLAVVRGVYRTPKKLRLFFERCTAYSASEIDEIIDYIRNNVPPKKKEFLGQIDRIAPWGEWVAEIKPWDYKGERGVDSSNQVPDGDTLGRF